MPEQLLEEYPASYIQQEFAAFQVEPWGDEWRPVATWMSANIKDIKPDQVLSAMLGGWNGPVMQRDQTDEEIYDLLERRFGG